MIEREPMKKFLLVGGLLVAVAAIIFTATQWTNIKRFQYALSLFSGSEQYENFANIKNLFPVSEMTPSTSPYSFPNADRIVLPESFSYQDTTWNTEEFLSTTDTGALLVLKSGEVVYEQYSLSGGVDVNWLSMSVAKSFTSLALGIAIDEGLISSIEDPVTDYLPSLKQSAYDNVRIKDILQMSSGAAWNEDYSDPDSEVLRMGKIMALGGSLDEFITTLERDRKPGTFNQYNSADTQVLGALLVKATGRTMTDYMQEKIWQPLGMENSGYWIVDDYNMEMAFAGLNVTARDYAKLGELYRNLGNWHGKQIVSADWIKASDALAFLIIFS